MILRRRNNTGPKDVENKRRYQHTLCGILWSCGSLRVSDETKPYLNELILALHLGMLSLTTRMTSYNLCGNKAVSKGGIGDEDVVETRFPVNNL